VISLEKAKALKEAGLKPLYGHLMSEAVNNYTYHGELLYQHEDGGRVYHGRHEIKEYYPLDYLLAEIERWRYAWSLKLLNRPQYRVILYPKGLAPGGNGSSIFTADTPEDAAADALLWILKQEGK